MNKSSNDNSLVQESKDINNDENIISSEEVKKYDPFEDDYENEDPFEETKGASTSKGAIDPFAVKKGDNIQEEKDDVFENSGIKSDNN